MQHWAVRYDGQLLKLYKDNKKERERETDNRAN
jgi:hypothetical protein